MEKLQVEIEEALTHRDTLIYGLLERFEMSKAVEQGPSIEKMYDLMCWTLGGIFLSKNWTLEYCREISGLVKSYPTAYDVIDSIFAHKYPMTKRNQKICMLFKSYVKDQLTGLVEIAEIDGPDAQERINALASQLSQKLHDDLGIYLNELHREFGYVRGLSSN